MDTSIKVKSVGVLGLSSKITTFVIDIELDGGIFRIEDKKLHFKNTLRTSYRQYDASLEIVANKSLISNLDNMVKPADLNALIDDYVEMVWVINADKSTTRERRSQFGLNIPNIEDVGTLKNAILNEVKLAYKKYINLNLDA